MEFRIADTFTGSLDKLTNDEQKAVKTTAFDLQMNPAHRAAVPQARPGEGQELLVGAVGPRHPAHRAARARSSVVACRRVGVEDLLQRCPRPVIFRASIFYLRMTVSVSQTT